MVAVSIQELTKDFSIGLRGVKLRAVDHLSLSIEEGQVYGLLGPNGSGKSTAMKVILGLLEPTRGHCEIFGTDSRKVDSRRSVGFLPEAPYFYRYLSGRELVRFYGKASGMDAAALDKRVDAVIERVGLAEAARRRVGTYSKGMLQRIGIAQAIVHEPRLVVLDEPTAGVDPIGSAEIAELILQLKAEGKTILLCSHLLAQVEGICDRVAILNRGRLVLEGAVDTLLEREDSRQLTVDHLSEAGLEAVKECLSQQGATLQKLSRPRVQLDQLFLEKVAGKGIGSDTTQDKEGRP